jgi:hypothetical protein
MNAWGWLFMSCSLALVWGATIWTYARLFRAPPEEPDQSTEQNTRR